MWCWHHIRENLNGLCPACRTPYNADPHAFSAVETQDIINKNKEEKRKEKDAKKHQSQPANGAGGTKSNSGAPAAGPGSAPAAAAAAVGTRPVPVLPPNVDRRHLHNYRVVQRNLVYVIGLPGTLVSEEMLRRPEYFGQYGRIGKIVIHKTHGGGGGNAGGSAVTSVSAYVTFVHKEDAKASIQSLEGHWMDNHVLRASFGTTKYCNNFIRGLACNNPDCVYLHEMGNDEDRFTKAEIQAGHSKLAPVPGQNQQVVTGMGGPSGTGRAATTPVMPPPVFLKDVTPPELPASSAAAAGSSSSPVKGGGNATIQRSSSWNNNGQGVPVALTRSTSNGSESDAKAQQSREAETDALTSEKEKESLETAQPLSVAKDDKELTIKSNRLAKAAERDRIAADKRFAEQAAREKQEKAVQDAAAKAADKFDKAEKRASADAAAGDVAASTEKHQAGREANATKEEDKVPASLKTTVERPSKTEDMGGLVSASFNGLGKCAVFTVPISSFSANTVWSAIINSSYNSTGDPANLDVNPFLMTGVSVSELLDLTLPPVDAVGLPVWPKPASHYIKPTNNTTALPPVQPKMGLQGQSGVYGDGMGNQSNNQNNNNSALQQQQQQQGSSGGASPMPSGNGSGNGNGNNGNSSSSHQQNGGGQNGGQNHHHHQQQQQQQQGHGQTSNNIRTLQTMFPKARVSG